MMATHSHGFTIPHVPYEPLWPAWQERHHAYADEIDARENEAAITREAERTLRDAEGQIEGGRG
jgi:hypothetical protein